jgi:hypothetical protein
MTEQTVTDSLLELVRRQRAERGERIKPANYTRPAYGTREWYGDYGRGWFGDAERFADEAAHAEQVAKTEARSARAKQSRYATATVPTRWTNKAPRPTQQYANPMATTGIRDARLCMGARALLVLIRARCGKGNFTEATKYALAFHMGRSTRTIQRYLVDLVRFGYLKADVRTNRKGMFTGLRIRLTEKVAPFWAKHEELAKWMHNSNESLGFKDRTKVSYKNHLKNLSTIGKAITGLS